MFASLIILTKGFHRFVIWQVFAKPCLINVGEASELYDEVSEDLGLVL
jgi:hypothetical protein